MKPVPPVMFQIAQHSRDHSREVYEQVVIPLYQRMDPAPRYSLTQFMAGTHGYMSPDEAAGLPHGIGPAVFRLWEQAIKSGWFVVSD